jgi:hypothetical protein
MSSICHPCGESVVADGQYCQSLEIDLLAAIIRAQPDKIAFISAG